MDDSDDSKLYLEQAQKRWITFCSYHLFSDNHMKLMNEKLITRAVIGLPWRKKAWLSLMENLNLFFL